MLGQGGSLFNLSLGDLKDFLDKANADPTRKLKAEFKNVSAQLEKIKEISQKEMGYSKEIVDSTKQQLRDRQKELSFGIQKAKLANDIKPKRTIRDKLDDLTGDTINLREMTTGGIGKMTLGALSASFAPIFLAYSEMNDIISEIGINTNQIKSTFMDINAETQELVRRNERLRGTSVGHLHTLISTQEVYGTMANASMQTLDTVESFPLALGMSVEQGREFLNTMRGITAEGANFNASMIRSLALLSKTSEVPMGWMMNDISENAEFFALRSGQGMENIAESVVYARRLGVQMGTITNMLSGLDTVDSVIESQMKLSLFTGQQINLLDSATANFFGDTKEATMSLLKQIENIDEATFKLPFVRKQMAEQLNVSATEMNNIYESVRRIGAESTSINLGFGDDLQSFKELFSGMGMTRIKRSLNENLLNPIKNAMNENMKGMNMLFSGIDKGIKLLGGVFTPIFEAMPMLIPIGTAIIGGIGMIGAGNILQGQQVSLLTQIRNLLSIGSANKGINWGSKTTGFSGKMMAGIGAFGGGMGLVGEFRKEKEDRSAMSMALNSALIGASLGSIIPGVGNLVGGAVGAGAGALTGLALHGGLAEGGIATTPMMSPIAETRPEAVIPLGSSKTKEMMTLNLTDTSIEKLARAISKQGTNITLEYKLNGKKMDDSEQFFDEIRR